jgi:hypothetical protein
MRVYVSCSPWVSLYLVVQLHASITPIWLWKELFIPFTVYLCITACFPSHHLKSPALPLQRLSKHSQLSYINCMVELSAPHLFKSCWAICSLACMCTFIITCIWFEVLSSHLLLDLIETLLSCQLLCLVGSCWACFAPWSVESSFPTIVVILIYIASQLPCCGAWSGHCHWLSRSKHLLCWLNIICCCSSISCYSSLVVEFTVEPLMSSHHCSSTIIATPLCLVIGLWAPSVVLDTLCIQSVCCLEEYHYTLPSHHLYISKPGLFPHWPLVEHSWT